MKKLVAYFSASGVTARTAKILADVTDADLYEIVPREKYTAADLDWTNKNSRSSVEMSRPDFRPQIDGKVENMEEYDTVFVGFPIWWYVAPTIINTFLESYDFSGKTVIPFATSGGSGMGRTDSILHKLCSDKTQWKASKLLKRADKDSLTAWVKDLNL